SGNRIYGNTTGISASVVGNVNGLGFVGTTLPNEIYGNATGVLLTGQMQNQHVFSNTTGVAGSGMLVGNDLEHARLLELTTNDLHASGTGKLVFWTRDFTDVLDWQEDVAQFDLHSIGATVVHPLWSEPRFYNRNLDDYRIYDEVARQRFSSPTIDTGDALADQ